MAMPHDSQVSGAGDEAGVAAAPASRLLKLGLNEPNRPVDELLERLSASDGASWLISVLSTGMLASFGPAPAIFADGGATLDHLQTIKQESTELLQRKQDTESVLHACTGYFLAVGAALAHHDELISSRPREDLASAFRDLAAVAPDPYAALFGAAHHRLTPS